MRQQPLYRASVQIVEQINGFYLVRASSRFEHVDNGETTDYPNLTWAEVRTLVDALSTYWEEQRRRHHASVFLPTGQQLSLDEVVPASS